MALYGGIDLHSNNSLIVLIDQDKNRIFKKRLPNEMNAVKEALSPYKQDIAGLVVESTYNWYWLVDGLMDEGYELHLANPAAMKQYEGIKYTDDVTDVEWLALMLLLDILPTGYIYPKEIRPIRDLLRKRNLMVRQRTAQLLSLQGYLCRTMAMTLSVAQLRKIVENDISLYAQDQYGRASIMAHLSVIECFDLQIHQIETLVKKALKPNHNYYLLKTVDGIGDILSFTIVLETGDISRFAKVGDYASYSRCVGSEKLSNGKKKGKGNTKSGNKHLGWAYVEAANFAIRFQPVINRYYQKKRAKTNHVVAIKTIAHKLARACFHMLRHQEPFDLQRAFGHPAKTK